VISHAMWRDRFGAPRDVIGKPIVLDRRPFTIVGVMPDGLALPEAGVRLWIPWNISAIAASASFAAADSPRDQPYLCAIARLRPDASLEQAQDQLNGVARDLSAKYP